MPNSFQEGADQSTNNQDPTSQGASFGDQGTQDQSNQGQEEANNNLDKEQLQALVKRDEYAQQHITTLEDENKQFRQELEAINKRLEDVGNLDELLSKDHSVDVDSLVQQATVKVNEGLEAKQAQELQKNNLNKVSVALASKFGEKVDAEAAKVAVANGLSFQELFDLAKTKPQLVMNMCDVKAEGTPSPTQSSYNSGAFQAIPDKKELTGMDLYESLTRGSDKDRIDYLNQKLNE